MLWLQVNAGHEEGADVGPLISPAAKQRVKGLIQSAADEVGVPRSHGPDTSSKRRPSVDHRSSAKPASCACGEANEPFRFTIE